MKTLQNEKINIKIILAALWVAVMFIYVYADIKTLFQPEIPQQIISGIIGGMTINQSFLFAAAILMSIPPIMIILSLTLKPSINRWVNIIISFLHIILIIITRFVPAKIWYYYFPLPNYLVCLEMANTRRTIEYKSPNHRLLICIKKDSQRIG
jgi:hypothetical protein